MRNPITSVSKWFATHGTKRSDKWGATRAAWLRDHPTCAACGSKKNIEVHHKLPFHLFPALELDRSNLITLCEEIGVEHHLRVGHLGNWKKFNQNVENDAQRMLLDSLKSMHHHT